MHATCDPCFFAQLTGTSLGYTEVRLREVFSSALLIVVEFSLVFAVLGIVLNAALAEIATETLTWLSRLAGAVIIFLGLHMIGLISVPAPDREYAMKPSKARSSHLTPILFGASFAVAWTPCVGPILGSTLALATTQPASAFPLLLAYAFGLGMPFLLVGLFPARAFAFIKRHGRWARRIHLAFGVVLIGMGVLVFTSKLSMLANFGILNEVFL